MKELLVVGTYTTKAAPGILPEQELGKGIYKYSYDGGTGAADLCFECAEALNPSFLAADESGSRLFAVSETGAGACFMEYGISGDRLCLHGSYDFEGEGACHVSYNPDRGEVAVSCYISGSLSVFDVKNHGHPVLRGHLAFTGNGPNKERQEKAHIHSTMFYGDSLLAADLGSDRIHMIKLEKDGLRGGQDILCRPGSGPRHMCMRRCEDGERLYIINELDCTLSVFAVKGGMAEEISVCPLVRGGAADGALAAELHCSRDGYLYASVRGTDQILVFEIIRKDGSLKLVQQVGSGGRGPRSFCLDVSEKHLITANQQDGRLYIFRRQHGYITEQASVVEVPAPVKVLTVQTE